MSGSWLHGGAIWTVSVTLLTASEHTRDGIMWTVLGARDIPIGIRHPERVGVTIQGQLPWSLSIGNLSGGRVEKGTTSCSLVPLSKRLLASPSGYSP
jgi:hypothetical protein